MRQTAVASSGDSFILATSAQGDVATFRASEIYERGAEETDVSSEFSIREQFADCGGGLFRRLTRVTNFSTRKRAVRLALRAETAFAPTHWLIPCVMYNGNAFGARNSPKGLTHQGEPWSFAYDRSGIPGCTLSESDTFVFAIFASDRDETSLHCACRVEKLSDGRFLHALLYPVTESPVSYIGKNTMGAPYAEFRTLPSGGSVEIESYVFAARPRWPKYGYYNLLQRALPALRHEHLPAMDAADVKAVCLDFLRHSRGEADGKPVYGITLRDYTHPIGNAQTGGAWDGLTLRMIEDDPSLNRMTCFGGGMCMGFASQGMMTLRMLLADAFARGDDALREEALSILRGWLSLQRPNGLISVSYPVEREQADPSSLGWGASEAVKIGKLLREHGVQSPDCLACARGICDFFVSNFDPDDPFGRLWSLSGEKLLGGGCNGSFLVKALLEVYEACGETRYLACARDAFDAYFRLELDEFRCSAGAIDCDSVDKESAFPFVYAGLALHRATGDRRYLECAEKAASYFLSWMFLYDARYDGNSEFAKLGYHTSGGTAVSTEHQCIDPYAVVLVPDLCELSDATGNSLWLEAARMIWVNGTQCLAGPNGCVMHGMFRPAGAQNECFAQTRWTKYRSSPDSRGHLNDFIGVWLCCFKLYALDRLGDALDEQARLLQKRGSRQGVPPLGSPPKG